MTHLFLSRNIEGENPWTGGERGRRRSVTAFGDEGGGEGEGATALGMVAAAAAATAVSALSAAHLRWPLLLPQ
jgi:hypothetical protein|eukprot:SAG25_NODE_172_length_13022_cov_64.797500_7_plen_73_part_00